MATPRERHPEMFVPLGHSSPRDKGEKTLPLEAMNLSFMRCGTASMHVAFQVLGMRCWHSTALMSTNYGDLAMWQEASERKFFKAGTPFGRHEFDQLLHDFSAVSSDIPALAFTEELIKNYPEAKVVLVERDIDSWYQSYEKGIIGNMYVSPLRFSPVVWLVYYLDPFIVRPMGRCQHRAVQGWLGAYSAADMRRTAKEAYVQHNELVRRLVSKDRLLEYQLKEGWEPLCKFLGKPVPDQPFPHINDQAYLNEKVNLFLMRGLRKLANVTFQFGVPILAASAIAWFYWPRSR